MAPSLQLLKGSLKNMRCFGRLFFSSSIRRQLLSDAYACNESWKAHLQDPTINQVDLNEFAFQVRDQLEKKQSVTAVDINVLTHQFHKMDEESVEFMEDILARFNLCQESFPRNNSTTHSIVRGFLSSNNGHRLTTLLTDRFTYGLLPNHYTLNLILDFYIKQGNYPSAAKIAYCSMLQEDFSNPVNTLLSLYAVVKHLLAVTDIDELAPPPKEASDGEENWIKVKYIKFPYYDDHFDIKDERFLLGKTLLMLGDSQSVDLPEDLRNSLRLIGCGLYHKFPRGLELMKTIVNSNNSTVSQKAIDYFYERLEKVEARDPKKPEVELALRTIDDVIHRMLPTMEEKDGYKADYSKITEQLLAKGKIVADYDIGNVVQNFVQMHVNQYEAPDISAQVKLFSTWTEERKKVLERQIEEYKKNTRIEEIKEQIKQLQQQEEILTYFDFEEQVRLKMLEEDGTTDPNLIISK